MNQQFQEITRMTEGLDRALLEHELRAMAQRAAAQAFARGMRRVIAKIRSVATRSRAANASGLRSA
ncbi:MAG: hypothetical protein LRY53_07940 [Burkholderiaceae bacterium]|nr:hypothetical protein [Burkholderiaceae bacterium]MCD8517602.1 hypothetical protein [Burkholderiaceae bacterium]MCD8537396.1 hypothetical protein [Burkholderiaceae bacterium]MCD8565554.1 hypothetical protein [Burkholderiaceae bacterium]